MGPYSPSQEPNRVGSSHAIKSTHISNLNPQTNHPPTDATVPADRRESTGRPQGLTKRGKEDKKKRKKETQTHLHSLLIPVLSKAPDLPPLDLKDRSRAPPRPPPRRLDALVRLPTVAPLGAVPQQHVPVLCPRLVEPHDPQVIHRRHHFRVRLGVVHGRAAPGECRRRPEPRVRVAEVRDRLRASVLRRRVGYRHVLLAQLDVFLLVGVVKCGLVSACVML